MTTAGDLAALYPFLEESAPTDASAWRDDLRRSTIAKLHESESLRHDLLEANGARLVACADAIADALAWGATVFTFGNGGSSTDAAAFAALVSGVLPAGATDATNELATAAAVAVTSETATITALANDIGYENAIARVVDTLGREGDVAVAISTSGNSENLIEALRTAGRRGMLRVALAGYDGGRFAEPGLVDHLFVVPSASVHRIQEAQTALYHRLAQQITVASRRSRSRKGARA